MACQHLRRFHLNYITTFLNVCFVVLVCIKKHVKIKENTNKRYRVLQ